MKVKVIIVSDVRANDALDPGWCQNVPRMEELTADQSRATDKAVSILFLLKKQRRIDAARSRRPTGVLRHA